MFEETTLDVVRPAYFDLDQARLIANWQREYVCSIEYKNGRHTGDL